MEEIDSVNNAPKKERIRERMRGRISEERVREGESREG